MFVLILLIIISLSWGDAFISYDRNGITAKVFFLAAGIVLTFSLRWLNFVEIH